MAFKHRYGLQVCGLGLLGLAASVAAQAAPQALALLETGGATPLVCDSGVCKAEFTTYCLQKERPLPAAGTAYEVVDGGALQLVLTGADGSVRRVQAGPYIRISTTRAGHTAVAIELPADVLVQFAARRASIEAGVRVTLAPVATAGDHDPLTDDERRIAAGPLRALGAKIVDRGERSVREVRVLNRLVNAMPDAIDIEPGARTRLWNRALSSGFDEAPAGDRAYAATEYAACWQNRVVELGGVSVRECLGRRHDQLMWGHGERYWKAVGAGS